MLGSHNSFDDGTLAQAIAESRSGTALEIRGVLGPKKSPRTMAERNQLQRRGFATAFDIDGKLVAGALLTTAGTSLLHGRHVDNVMRHITTVEPQVDAPDFGREWFERKGWAYPSTPVFAWAMLHCDLVLAEASTGSAFMVVPWQR